jgi:hypothetical protein
LAVEEFCGGPRAQADFDESWEGILGTVGAIDMIEADDCEREKDLAAVEEFRGGP